MPNWKAYEEAEKRGILPESKASIYAEAKRRGLIPSGVLSEEPTEPVEKRSFIQNALGGAKETVKNIGRVYPVLETAANLATSAYGVPVSGLAGLFELERTKDLNKANEAINKTMDTLVYQPQTKGGQHLTGAAMSPVAAYNKLGDMAGDKLEEAGHPMLGATAATAIQAAPVVLSGRVAVKSANAKIKSVVKEGVDKGIRPTVVGKGTATKQKVYYKKAQEAVEEIVLNKDNLEFITPEGTVSKGQLPKNLDEFSQAIEQTKKKIFEEYDSLVKETDAVGIEINLNKIGTEVGQLTKNKVVQDLSPETIAYAEKRIEALSGRGRYTAAETQEAIRLLNKSLESYYKDPSALSAGKAVVDKLIADNLRKSLDEAVDGATGVRYQPLKNKYGSLKAIEKEVNHRAVVDARKGQKGFFDIGDIFTSYHAISALLKMDPVGIVASGGAKGVGAWMKAMTNPNRKIKSMFNQVDGLITARKNNAVPISILTGAAAGADDDDDTN